jgi:hypothetical protein
MRIAEVGGRLRVGMFWVGTERRVAPFGVVLAFLCLLLPPMVRGADVPKAEIKAHAPLYVRAGHTTTLIIYGDNLAPKGVTASRPQVGVKLIETKPTEGEAKAKGGKQVTLEVSTPHGYDQNGVELTLTQPDGVKVTLPLPILEDVATETVVKGPHGNYALAMPLPGPSAGLSGALDNDTAATFCFDAKAGDTWDFTLLAGRAGSALDALLRLRDSRHLSLALSAGNPKLDRHIHFRAPADGTYYLEVGDDQARGGPTFTYVMTATRRSN